MFYVTVDNYIVTLAAGWMSVLYSQAAHFLMLIVSRLTLDVGDDVDMCIQRLVCPSNYVLRAPAKAEG